MFVFLIKDKGIVIETLPVPMAKNSDKKLHATCGMEFKAAGRQYSPDTWGWRVLPLYEAGKIACMGLADYPRDYEVLLEEQND